MYYPFGGDETGIALLMVRSFFFTLFFILIYIYVPFILSLHVGAAKPTRVPTRWDVQRTPARGCILVADVC